MQEAGSGDTVDAQASSGTSFTGPNTISQGGHTYHLDDPQVFRYRMDNVKRGYFVIINNKTFHARTQMGERSGTDQDAAALYQCFKELEFQVEMFQDQTTTKMLDIMQKVSTYDHSDCDCFGLAILSHGDNGIIYGTDGVIRLDTLFEPLKGDKCHSLRGKPKFIIVQACRGTSLDHGVEVSDALAESDEDTKKQFRIPAEADILYAYSTVPGFFSWRNSTRGSWFIQALSRVLREHGQDREIMWILTRVSYIVAYDYESNASRQEMNQKKQMPQIVSMLTKELFFPRKN